MLGRPNDPDPDPLPDLDLVELFDRHRDGLAGAVRGVLGGRADVAEVLQDAFLNAWRAVQEGKRPEDPLGWVFVLTLNRARDHRRRLMRHPAASPLDETTAVQIPTAQPEPTRQAEGTEALAAARDAIRELAATEQEVFLLRVSGELSFPAIAEALGIPVGTAKSRMRAALGRLRHQLAGHAPGLSSLEMEGGAR